MRATPRSGCRIPGIGTLNETTLPIISWAETVTRVAETGVPNEAYEAARAVFDKRELVI